MYIKEPLGTLSVHAGNFGVDKLHLFTEHFEVSDLTPWNVKPNTKRAGETDVLHTPLLAVKGQTVHGEKMFYNAPGLYMAEVKHGRLHVQFNPSKIFHPFNLISDPDRLADAIMQVQEHLQEHLRTDADLFSTSVSRIDPAAQAAMKNPVPFYDSVVRSAKSMKRAPRTEYPHGFLIGNGARQVCTYDKGLKLDIDSGKKNPLPSNFFRVETRMTNPRAVRQHTPFATVADLLAADAPDKLKWAYTKTLTDLMQMQQTQMQMVELSAITELVKTAQVHKERDWLQFVVLVLSDIGTLPTPAEFEQALVPLVHEGLMHDKTRSRNVKKYKDLIHQTQMVRARFQQQTETNYADLHTEFATKFLDPYRIAL